MKYRFTKSFNVGDIIDSKDVKLRKTDDTACVDGKSFTLAVPDYLEEVKEVEYRYCDTGNIIQPKGNWYAAYKIDGYGFVEELGFEKGSRLETKFLKNLVDVGHCFETREGAEKHLAFLKARATLKRFMMEKNKTDDRNYDFWYKVDEEKVEVASATCWTNNEFWFNIEKDAEECIKLYTPELKIVLGVE